MSLPWFAFNIGAYVKDTMRLSTEGHGAYLLLMLDYYATEKAPPDDDEVLASICKLPVEVWTAKHRKVLAPFFDIKDGRWFHNRIEREMLEACSKHAASIAHAKAAANARWKGTSPRGPKSNAPRLPKAQPEHKSGIDNAASMREALPPALPEQSQKNAHKHKHSLITEREEGSLSKALDELSEKDSKNEGQNSVNPDVPIFAHEPEEDSIESMGTPIDPAFKLGENQIAVCTFDGASPEVVAAELAGFIDYHREKGSFSNDWDASWGRWWKRWKEHRDKLAAKQAKPKATAPPRIEVNNTPDWDNLVTRMWIGMGRWPRSGAGGEPGQLSCRCPPEILRKHGIDPETGLPTRNDQRSHRGDQAVAVISHAKE